MPRSGFAGAMTVYALALQPLDDAVPARRVGEGAVHKHDRRLHIGLLGPFAGHIQREPPAVPNCALR